MDLCTDTQGVFLSETHRHTSLPHPPAHSALTPASYHLPSDAQQPPDCPSWLSLSPLPAGSRCGGGVSAIPPFPARWELALSPPPEPAEAAAAAALCPCSSRVHRHAEYRGAVHLHRGPAAAALRDILHRGARGADHGALRLCEHRLPRGRLPQGKRLLSVPRTPEGFAVCARGRSVRICVLCVQNRLSQSLWNGHFSSPRHFVSPHPHSSEAKSDAG